MKKTASVFLLIIFLFNLSGFFGLFTYLKELNYESIFRKDINELNLVRLTIPKIEDINWEKNDEIIYQGKYFDVFSKSEDRENYFLLCYSDSKENELIEAFGKHVCEQNENTSEKSGSNSLVKIIIQDFTLHSFSWKSNVYSSGKIPLQIFFSTRDGFSSILSPPPEVV